MTDAEYQSFMQMQKHIEDRVITLPAGGEPGKVINVCSNSTLDTFILISTGEAVCQFQG